MKTIATCLALLCLTSCTSPGVTARTFYTSRRDLASYVLDTPDPDKTTSGLGQVIWVRWTCPKVDPEMVIDATLRFKDGTERNNVYPVDSRYGWLMIEVPNDEYKKKGDILSYKIVLRRNTDILATTEHKLWVDAVVISDT